MSLLHLRTGRSPYLPARTYQPVLPSRAFSIEILCSLFSRALRVQAFFRSLFSLAMIQNGTDSISSQAVYLRPGMTLNK
jgi:hypothetical protein